VIWFDEAEDTEGMGAVGCNVGYAFVNFIHVQDLLTFAKARLGIKWYEVCIPSVLLRLIPSQEHVLEREGLADELRELPVASNFTLAPPPCLTGVHPCSTRQRQRSTCRKVQKFMYHGRARSLETEDLPL
jgi:hypothetical protein